MQGMQFDPGQGTNIPHAATTEPMQHNQSPLLKRKDPMMQDPARHS